MGHEFTESTTTLIDDSGEQSTEQLPETRWVPGTGTGLREQPRHTTSPCVVLTVGGTGRACSRRAVILWDFACES